MRWLIVLAGLVSALVAPLSEARQPADPLTARAVPQYTKVHAGEQFAVAVIIEVEDHWHIWPSASKGKLPSGVDGLAPWWTKIGPREGAGTDAPAPAEVRLPGFRAFPGGIQWPDPVELSTAALTGSPIKLLSYAGRMVAFVPVVVDADAAPGVQKLEWALSFQACDDSVCQQPTDLPLSATWEVVANEAPLSPHSDTSIFTPFEAKVFGTLGSLSSQAPTVPVSGPTSTRASFDFFGYSFTLGANQYALIFLIAFVAGILLNLTPCVLPVIPIKVMSLQKQAGNPGKLLLYGAVYCIGIVAMFAVLGLLIAFARQQWGQLFSMPWFAATMGAIVLVLGIGMMGVFTIRLPQAVYMINPAGDTLQGNFLMGVLTAILSTPCTGPFFGAALAWAATQPTWVGLTTLIVVGAGMASPYALLIAFPKLIDKMPRSGPGGELLKQVLGGLMVAVAAYLFSNLVHGSWTWWVIGGIAAAAFAWALLRIKLLRTGRGRAMVAAVSMLGIAASLGLGYVMTRPSGIPWQTIYTASADSNIVQKAIDDARASGKFVVVKFTANWCVNCHVIEKTVFNTTTGIQQMNRTDVVAIKVDLSRGNDEGYQVLKKLSGGTGIPFSIFFRPGEEPVSFRSFFKVSDLRRALERKSGRPTAGAPASGRSGA